MDQLSEAVKSSKIRFTRSKKHRINSKSEEHFKEALPPLKEEFFFPKTFETRASQTRAIRRDASLRQNCYIVPSAYAGYFRMFHRNVSGLAPVVIRCNIADFTIARPFGWPKMLVQLSHICRIIKEQKSRQNVRRNSVRVLLLD